MNLTGLTIEEQKHIYSKVKELQTSDGWKFIQNIIAAEREEFMRKVIGPSAPLDEKVYHYNRGIMESTYRLQDLPNKVLTELNSAIKLHEAVKKSSEPTTT